MFEATAYAARCEVSRTTVTKYLQVLEDTSVVHVVRPYSTRRATEIVAAPKVYGFDSGFVCFFNGWDVLRDEDRGALGHYVLNEYRPTAATRHLLARQARHQRSTSYLSAGSRRCMDAVEADDSVRTCARFRTQSCGGPLIVNANERFLVRDFAGWRTLRELPDLFGTSPRRVAAVMRLSSGWNGA